MSNPAGPRPRKATGLSYWTAQDFDSAAGEHDHDPLKWISRVQIAHEHAQVLRRYAERDAV